MRAVAARADVHFTVVNSGTLLGLKWRSVMADQFACPICEAVFDDERQLLDHFCPGVAHSDTEPAS